MLRLTWMGSATILGRPAATAEAGSVRVVINVVVAPGLACTTVDVKGLAASADAPGLVNPAEDLTGAAAEAVVGAATATAVWVAAVIAEVTAGFDRLANARRSISGRAL